jgi:hypothetical protein
MRGVIKLLLLAMVLFLFIKANRPSHIIDKSKIVDLIEYTPWYMQLTDSAGLSKAALLYGYENFINLNNEISLKNDSLLTIVDFSQPSNKKRLYVIDVKNQKLLVQSLVAHGQNSGLIYAKKFSNRPSSHMSSLGAYITASTYSGKHGYSLRLDGQDPKHNSKARERAIVIHGANYVSEQYIKNNGRIGRSFGCPALPKEINNAVIDLIKDGSCLYIYHPSIN